MDREVKDLLYDSHVSYCGSLPSLYEQGRAVLWPLSLKAAGTVWCDGGGLRGD